MIVSAYSANAHATGRAGLPGAVRARRHRSSANVAAPFATGCRNGSKGGPKIREADWVRAIRSNDRTGCGLDRSGAGTARRRGANGSTGRGIPGRTENRISAQTHEIWVHAFVVWVRHAGGIDDAEIERLRRAIRKTYGSQPHKIRCWLPHRSQLGAALKGVLLHVVDAGLAVAPIFATSIVSYALTGFGAEFSYLLPCRALYSGAPAPLLNEPRDGHAGMDSWRQLWHFTYDASTTSPQP